MTHTPLKHLYTTTIPIRWSDIDEYGHVNHAQYAVLMQEARLQWLLDIEHHQKFSYIFPIVEMHFQFRKSLNFPGDCIIKLLSEKPGKRMWVLHHELYRADDIKNVYATAWIKSVCYNPQSKRTMALPEDFKKAFYS